MISGGYFRMYAAYLQYENEYWKWAELRKQFNQTVVDRVYYRRNNARNRRKMAEKVIADFPELFFSAWDLHDQIGGCRDIVYGFGLCKWENDVYVTDVAYGGTIYIKLKNNPDLIYRAIEETYEWSIELGIRTTLIEDAVPAVIEFIAKECIV